MSDIEESTSKKPHRHHKTGQKAVKKKANAEKKKHRFAKKPAPAATTTTTADSDGEEHQQEQQPEMTEEEKRAKAALRNPRAFSIQSVTSARRMLQRRAEKIHKKLHFHIVDRNAVAAEPPPVVVAVAGPPGVGKSTLITSLVKHYTRRNVVAKGPITVVSGKKRRLTFIEVPNDLNAMVDVA